MPNEWLLAWNQFNIMGIDYSINLYYPIEQLDAVLLKLPSIASIDAGASTAIELPNGRCISLPFNNGLKSSVVQLKSPGSSITLDTTIIFDVDDPIRDFIRQNNWEKLLTRSRKQIPIAYGASEAIGYIYLHITLGHKNAEMAFTAAASNMSKLFVNSESIHNKFIDFMESTKGLLGLIDIEKSHYLLLANPKKEVRPASVEIETEVNPYFDLDLLIEDCLQQI
jgi:hypothetical protein